MVKYSTLNIEFLTPPDLKQPWLNDDGSFYIIYLPEKVKLRPRESIMLDLELKINLPEGLEQTMKLLPCYTRNCLSLENLEWLSNKAKEDTIQLDILNKDFYNMVNIQKNQALLNIFLINQKSYEKIVTKYKIHNKKIS